MVGDASGSGIGVPAEKGIILPILLFLLLALTLLAQGTLLLARRELQATLAFLHATRATHGARGGVDAGLRVLVEGEPVPSGSGVVSLHREILPEGVGREARVQVRGAETLYLEGEGRSRGWSGRRAVGAMAWRLDPATRIGAFRGGVEAKGVGSLSGGFGSVDPLRDVPTGWGTWDCLAAGEVLDSIFPRGLPLLAELRDPEALMDPDWVPGLGLLTGARILAMGLGEEMGGRGTRPDGGCRCSRGEAPCLVARRGTLTLSGGEFCGLLVSGGDLRIRKGALVQGVALVGGDLVITDQGAFEGMARSAGTLSVDGGSRLSPLGCPALRVLQDLDPLRRPLLLAAPFPVSPPG